MKLVMKRLIVYISLLSLLELSTPKPQALAFDIDVFINQDLTAIRKIIADNDFTGYTVKPDEVLLNATGGIFTAPVMPVAENGFAGKKIYLTFFKPSLNDNWHGNLKKFTFKDGYAKELINQDGGIRASVVFNWSSGDGSNKIESGGAAAIMLNKMVSRRKVYTYPDSGNPKLAAFENNFDTSNALISARLLQVLTEDERRRVITFVRAAGFGAVLHSRPATVFYPAENRNILFIGTNNGVLHCIDASTGEELWAFIFPEHLPKLKSLLHSNIFFNAWFVDNVPVVHDVNGKKILICGSRRGGYTYVALDITDFRNPLYLYSTPTHLADDSRLGLSWGIPVFAQTHTNVKASDAAPPNPFLKQAIGGYKGLRDVVIIPGGYNPNNDFVSETALPGESGGIIWGFEPLSGNAEQNFSLLNYSANPIMEYSITDLTALSRNNQNVIDRIYFGDLGGNLFCAMPYQGEKINLRHTFVPSAKFSPFKLFSAGDAESSKLKIMYAPAVLKEDCEYIYFGTGDGENPFRQNGINRFYCVKFNNWGDLACEANDANYLTEANLADITNYEPDSNHPEIKTQNAYIEEQLQVKNGWMLVLEEDEFITARPLIYNGVVYFSTFKIISKGSEMEIPAGEGRLYGLDCKTGAPALKPTFSGSAALDIPQRYIFVGNGPPTEPSIFILGNTVIFMVCSGDKLFMQNLDMSTTTKIFYWREFF